MHKHFSINAIMLNARFPQLKPLAFQQLQRHLPGSGRESFSPPFCRPELTYTSTKGGSQKNFHKEATQQHTHTHIHDTCIHDTYNVHNAQKTYKNMTHTKRTWNRCPAAQQHGRPGTSLPFQLLEPHPLPNPSPG